MATPPVFDTFPPAPNRGDAPADFTQKADTFVAALPPFVLKMNLAISWMAATMATVLDYRDAAALSAQAALTSADNAASWGGQAVTDARAARDAAAASAAAALVSAQAAGAAAGFPVFVDGLDVLQVKPDKTGVQWGKVGQSIGDVLETTRTPDATYLLPDTIYTRAAYPALFAIIGTQGEKNDLATFSQVNLGFNVNFNMYDCASGLNSVIIAVGMSSSSGTTTNGCAFKSTDGGATWAALAALTGIDALSTINTDTLGVWIATSRVTSGKYYYSVDNGVTWTTKTGGFSGAEAAPSSMTLTTNRTGTWLAVANSGATNFSRSTDNGLTWAAVSTASIGAFNGISNDFLGTWYAIMSTVILRSEDAGSTWRVLYQNNINAPSVPYCGGTVSLMPMGQLGFSISTDKGLNWKTIVVPGFTQIAVDSSGTIFYMIPGKIYRSFDAGETWNITTLSQVYVAFWPKSLDANGNFMAAPYQIAAAVQPTMGYWWRSTRQYNYDVATQFKTPARKAQKGYKAYIKGKLA